jgi:hypothetical protein
MLSISLFDARLHASNLGLLAVYAAVFYIGLRIHQTGVWLLAALFILLSSIVAWLVNLKRFRIVDDTPTAKVISAPQGYVEFAGRGKQPPGDELTSFLTGLPCLWYRYKVERRSGDKWVHDSSGESHDTFGLDDGSGLVLIDPDGAEILTSRKRVWIEDIYRKTEWSLIEGEKLYAVGEHATVGGAQSDFDTNNDISLLLSDWKKDKASLLKRFDRNHDGEIDLAEWELVREAAELEVEQEHQQIRLSDGVHVLRKPRDGRPYLIANKLPGELIRRYQIWSWTYLFVALASLGSLPWIAR